MAAAASNSSSSSSFIASQAKYDVFLNFRGEDTRRIFTCHLYNALRGKNIYTFMDDEAIESGDEVSPTLLSAIEKAKLSIVILSEKLESDLVMAITEEVLRKLNHVSNPEVPSNLVGIRKHVEHVESLLRIGFGDVRIVGIWGMGGIGKTTIAENLFKKHFDKFEGCCFLENVREEWKKQGKKELRNKLLSKILGDQEVHASSPSISSTFVVDRLGRRRVLIVLDDVNNTQQIEDLIGEKAWFGLGSRIIVTLRDKDVLNENDRLYKVMQMNNKDALQFFSLKAFGLDQPKCEFIDLSNMVVNYANGNPLALKVLGSLLHSKNQEEWKSMLKKLKKIPNKDIEHVLRLSFEELDNEEQQIFLDIACCLKGQTKWDVINLLDGCGYSTIIGLRSLENKSLITIRQNLVQMHNLIQEIGFQVVRQEFPKEIEKRSRLWEPEDMYHVLRRKRGMDYSVESMLLNMAEIKDVEIGPKTFNRMQKLRILRFYLPIYDERCNVRIPKGLESLPDELRCLHWDLFPLKCLPPSFCPEMLVQVNLRGSLIEKLWEGEQDLANLKSLSLSRCEHLIELPNLSKATNLEEIHLDNCVSLCNVPSSMLSLDSLMALDLRNCRKLQCIRSDNRSIKWLNLSGCSKLAKYSVNSENLKFLSIEGTAIENLPLSVERVKNLRCFYFSECERLENLPENFYQIGLETLDVQIYFDYCPKLKKLPPISDNSFPITILHLDYCSNLSELPEDLGYLSALHQLSIQGSSIETLPPSIKLLSHLQILNVSQCKRLQFLPELPISVMCLFANGCISLETMPSSAANALIQNFFESSNLRLLLRRVQESKGSIHWGPHGESVDFLNCTRLEENVCKTIMVEALSRMKFEAYVLPILKENAKCDPCDHELNEDLFGELLARFFKMPVNYGTTFPSWFSIQDQMSFGSSSCTSCLGWYTAFDLFKETHYGHGSRGICLNLMAEYLQYNNWKNISYGILPCSSCLGCYTAFDLLKKQYWTNTHYGLGSQRICLDLLAGSFRRYCRSSYWFHAVNLCLPGSTLPSCFTLRTTETSITIELPPRSDLLGLAFCLVFSPKSQFAPSPPVFQTKIGGRSFFLNHSITSFPKEPVISDHVLLYYHYDINRCLVRNLKVKECKANNQRITDNLKISFGFYYEGRDRKDGIKECGVLPLYASDIASELSTCPEEIEIEDTNYKTSVLNSGYLGSTREDII